MASRAILSNFFEEQRTQNHRQYLSGLSRTLFPTTFLEIAVYETQAIKVRITSIGELQFTPKAFCCCSQDF